jgi:phosphatidylinositol phospholipase C, delta
VRIYPSGKRQDSSNYHPNRFWQYGEFVLVCSERQVTTFAGAQMVALNFQADDRSMCLQHGLFSDNGACGYLLKPDFLRSSTLAFDPKEKFHSKGKRLQLEVISAQHLPKKKDDIGDRDVIDPYVRVCTFGIDCDCSEHETSVIHNNGLNPRWNDRITLDIFCPELCLFYIEVRDQSRFNTSSFIGHACVPFAALRQGYRHVKLKALNGDYTHGTLFLHVKIDEI